MERNLWLVPRCHKGAWDVCGGDGEGEGGYGDDEEDYADDQ